MKYVGIDLHKKTIALCVVDKERKVLDRKNFLCLNVKGIAAYFRELGSFQFVVEATAAYEWLVQLLEPLAEEWVLAHPGKMRVIAETAKKTDKLDAQTLAEFLALGMIPKAYRPTARQREHRVLVRHRVECRQRISRLKCQIRYLAATYNADHRDLFQPDHLNELRKRPDLTGADRFVLDERLKSYEQALERLAAAKAEVKRFAKKGSAAEQKEREILLSAPGVGEVVSEVVLAELGDVDRFGSIKEATAYAGLVPAKRESAGKGKDIGDHQEGLAAAALGDGRGGLASGAALGALANRLRKVEATARREASDHRGGQAAAGDADLDAESGSEISFHAGGIEGTRGEGGEAKGPASGDQEGRGGRGRLRTSTIEFALNCNTTK